VVKLSGSDKYTIKYFLNNGVMNLRFREDFANEIDWSLHPEVVAFLQAFHHDCRADIVSSRGDVE
jgi:hypothetical protein